MATHFLPNQLPAFQQMNVSKMRDQLITQLETNRQKIKALCQLEAPSWLSFIVPLSELDDALHQLWSPISHLHSVCNNAEIRPIYQQSVEAITLYGSEISQSKPLYQTYQKLTQQPEYADYTAAQKQVITHALRDFKLAGVHLADTQKTRLREIQQTLAQLSTTFTQNVLDATEAWHYQTTDEAELSGLPDYVMTRCQQKDGSWKIGLDMPTYIAVMTYADNRKLRETIYHAHQTRASDQGPNAGKWDNAPLMEQILTLRAEKASLLGFEDYIAYSLANKMSESFEQVQQFLQDLATRAKPKAKQERHALMDLAQQAGIEILCAWDISYYSEKLKQQRYQISDNLLRPYFPVEHVFKGLFALTTTLYDLSIARNDTIETWHKDASFYQVRDHNGQLIAGFYVDLYAREGKRGGAWMDDLQTRYRDSAGELHLPIAYLTCNFNPPVNDQPALLTHDEMVTLFHEFGHTLHHLLSNVDHYDVSGINGVPWDGVELPSQFMENFCWHQSILNQLSCHIDTGESLPDTLFKQLSASRQFNNGLHILRQVEFALFDLYIHRGNTQTTQQIQACLDQVRHAIAVILPPDYSRFQNSFSHIFSGGYAAGYFSYLWAEVLSADAFGAFEEHGITNTETSYRFRDTILAPGGSVDLMAAFKAFRGREPNVKALLRHLGLL